MAMRAIYLGLKRTQSSRDKDMFSRLFSIVIIFFALFIGNAHSSTKFDPLASILGNETKFLDVDQAFQFDFSQQGNTLKLHWNIADGYYLYADKFMYAAENVSYELAPKKGATQIEDEFFGVVDVYFFETSAELSLSDIGENAVIKVRYQGCAKEGLCYNPVTKEVPVSIISETTNNLTNSSGNERSQQYELADSLQNSSLLITLLVFFALGVGLAATPCVFPMFPILAGIIAGQKELTTRKGLGLAFIYVQGMAITYSILGLVVASMGSQFQAYLQHPAILIASSVLFLVLAAAMFGWINLQLPQSWTVKLTNISNQQKSGSTIGVFLMGVLSGLIASPCTTAPLTGALLYVAQTGDLAIGFLTLYVLSLGMGLPLLVIGASGGKLLPKAGDWMNKVKVIFGFVLLVVPIILLERIVDMQWIYLLAAIWLLALATYLHSVESNQSGKSKPVLWLVKMLVFTLAVFAAAKPYTQMTSPSHQAVAHTGFKQISNLTELEQELNTARELGKVVMFDLYADWCVACKEFEKYTFTDPTVQQQLSQFHMLQIDMTKTNADDLAVMEKYDVLGLPTIMFFDVSGTELTQLRVTGFQNAKQFSAHLDKISKP